MSFWKEHITSAFPFLNEPRRVLGRLRTLYVNDRRQFERHRSLCAQFPTASFHPHTFADAACQFGEKVIVGENTLLKNCRIGRYTYFAGNSSIMNCTIGAFCSIGPDTRAGLGQHPSAAFVSTHPGFYSQADWGFEHFVNQQLFDEYAPITIGNDVWIGARVLVMDGVKIGNGAIIGAGAVITKDVEPYSIVGGIPSRLIRKRFSEEQIVFLLKLSWWEKDISWIKSHANEFTNIDSLMRTIEAESQKKA